MEGNDFVFCFGYKVIMILVGYISMYNILQSQKGLLQHPLEAFS